MQLIRTVFLLSVFLIAEGCSGNTQQITLYDKLGGEQGVNQIVNNLVQNIGHDQQIFHYFAEANVNRFQEKLSWFLCDISDGPCTYTGDNMQLVHDGMHITERDFNHLVDLLVDAMYEADVSHPVQNQLLARLAPMRKDIFYR